MHKSKVGQPRHGETLKRNAGISLEESVIQQLDQLAQEKGIGRSQLVNQIILSFLRNKQMKIGIFFKSDTDKTSTTELINGFKEHFPPDKFKLLKGVKHNISTEINPDDFLEWVDAIMTVAGYIHCDVLLTCADDYYQFNLIKLDWRSNKSKDLFAI